MGPVLPSPAVLLLLRLNLELVPGFLSALAALLARNEPGIIERLHHPIAFELSKKRLECSAFSHTNEPTSVVDRHEETNTT